MSGINNVNMNQMLAQLRINAALAQGKPAEASAADASAPVDFGDLLKQSINKVNDMQQGAGKLAESFETGSTDVNVEQVMIAMQKANLSFQTMLQVRNKLVSAYQEIMNMPV